MTSSTATNEFFELVKLSKEIESVISNDTLPLLTENINETSRQTHNTSRHEGPGSSSSSSPFYHGDRVRGGRSIYGDDYDNSDDLTMGGEEGPYWDRLTPGNGGVTMVQTSQFLMDKGIKPRDLMESTETVIETVQQAKIRSVTKISLSTSQPSVSPAQSPSPTGQPMTFSQVAKGPSLDMDEESDLNAEVERKVRGRILGFDEYISAQRSAIQEYVTSFSLSALDKECTERCQEMADSSWDDTIRKFSGAQGKAGISSYLENGSAVMTPLFSVKAQPRKRASDEGLQRKITEYAEVVESARGNKTILDEIKNRRESKNIFGPMKDFWEILIGMFCPGESGNGGKKRTNSKVLLDNAMAFLGKEFGERRIDKMIREKESMGFDDNEHKWKEAYSAMLCNDYEEAFKYVGDDFAKIIKSAKEDAHNKFINKIPLSDGQKSEVSALLSSSKLKENPYKYTVLSIFAKRYENLKALQNLGFIRAPLEASWFILSTCQGIEGDSKALSNKLKDCFKLIYQTKSQYKEVDYLKSLLLFQQFNRFIPQLTRDKLSKLATITDNINIILSILDQFFHETDDPALLQELHNKSSPLIEEYVSMLYTNPITLSQAISYLRYTAIPANLSVSNDDGSSSSSSSTTTGVVHLFPIFDGEGPKGVKAAADKAIEVLGKVPAMEGFKAAGEELIIRMMKETAFYVLFRTQYEDRDRDLSQLAGAILGDTLGDPEGHRGIVGFIKANEEKLPFMKEQRFVTLMKLCEFFDYCKGRRLEGLEKGLEKLAETRFFPWRGVTVSEAEKAVMGSGFPQEAQRNMHAILVEAMSAVYNLWKGSPDKKQFYETRAAEFVKFAGLFRLILPKETMEFMNKCNDEINKLNYYH